MTLIEILMAMAIFLVVGTGMLGILIASGTLYRAGENSRQIGDEVMAVFSLLDEDLAKQLPSNQGGHFYAEVDPSDAGNTSIGWMRRAEVPRGPEIWDQLEFVIWFVDTGTLNLNRARFGPKPGNEVEWLDDPENPTFYQKIGGNELILNDVLHFGAALIDTDDNRVLPVEKTGWQLATDQIGNTTPFATLPNKRSTRYYTGGTELALYPRGLRIQILLAGPQSNRRTARLFGDLTDTSARIPLRGQTKFSSIPGTVIRIGNEMISLGGQRSANQVLVSKDPTGGSGTLPDRFEKGSLGMIVDPVGTVTFVTDPSDSSAIGRGVWNSNHSPHTRGADIYFGHQYSLTRLLD